MPLLRACIYFFTDSVRKKSAFLVNYWDISRRLSDFDSRQIYDQEKKGEYNMK